MFKRFLMDRNAATAVEYGLIVFVLSLAVVAGVGTAANSIEFLFGSSESKLNQAWR